QRLITKCDYPDGPAVGPSDEQAPPFGVRRGAERPDAALPKIQQRPGRPPPSEEAGQLVEGVPFADPPQVEGHARAGEGDAMVRQKFKLVAAHAGPGPSYGGCRGQGAGGRGLAPQGHQRSYGDVEGSVRALPIGAREGENLGNLRRDDPGAAPGPGVEPADRAPRGKGGEEGVEAGGGGGKGGYRPPGLGRGRDTPGDPPGR